MKLLRTSLLLILLGHLTPLVAQQGFFLRPEAATGTGWWIHHLGIDPDLNTSGGYDRSHLSLFAQGRLLLGWQGQNWGLTMGIQRGYYDDNQLVGSADRRGGRTRIKISDSRGVSLTGGSLGLHRRFVLGNQSTCLQLEALMMLQHVNHIHPDQEQMGLLWGPEWSIMFGSLRRHQWLIGPWLQDTRFVLSGAKAREAQRFLLLGVKLSYAFFVKK
ncbi:MAG: hypothetical protein AAFV07_08360 [Bacteroidota bacterium]